MALIKSGISSACWWVPLLYSPLSIGIEGWTGHSDLKTMLYPHLHSNATSCQLYLCKSDWATCNSQASLGFHWAQQIALRCLCWSMTDSLSWVYAGSSREHRTSIHSHLAFSYRSGYFWIVSIGFMMMLLREVMFLFPLTNPVSIGHVIIPV